jgi:hypothetical protein
MWTPRFFFDQICTASDQLKVSRGSLQDFIFTSKPAFRQLITSRENVFFFAEIPSWSIFWQNKPKHAQTRCAFPFVTKLSKILFWKTPSKQIFSRQIARNHEKRIFDIFLDGRCWYAGLPD